MTFETKQELLHQYMEMEKPVCPHCSMEMTLWEVPQIAIGDGLGWGSPYLFVCFNDECPSYKSGWDHLKETMEHQASYRCFQQPGTTNFEYMPVFSPEGGTGQILDDVALMEREAVKEATRQGFSVLTDFYISKDWDEIMKMLLDPVQPPKVRLKAAEMVGELGDADAVIHLVNRNFPGPVLQDAVNKTIEQLHERHYTRECPFCAEIIKKRATVCRHCNREISKG